MANKLIIIPSRLASSRLANKPLATIKGKTMIERVIEQAQKSNIKNILVALCDKEIEDVVKTTSVDYIFTDKNLPSGTDRISEALTKYDKLNEFDIIVNLQGDLPNIDPSYIETCANLLAENKDADIATLCFKIKDPDLAQAPNVVKTVLSKEKDYYNALYFSRSQVPYQSPCYYGHIGIYAYTTNSLKKFVSLSASNLEKIEKLEQLRALEAGMKIIAQVVEKEPVSVDVAEDIKRAENELAAK